MGGSNKLDSRDDKTSTVVYTHVSAWTTTWLVLCLARATGETQPATMFTATNAQKPGCQSKCGNLTIPYPFGIGKDCALSDSYTINCTIINGKITTQLHHLTYIIDISETEMTITNLPAARSCISDTKNGNVNNNNNWGEFHVRGTPFAISSSSNMFMVIGCHHYGLLRATARNGQVNVISCVALCTEKQDLLDDTCSGIGCCQVPLPRGLQDVKAGLEMITYNTSVTAGNCSYSFLAKNSSLSFRQASDLLEPDFMSKVGVLPTVIDWFIANATCREAQQNLATYVCQMNSICIDLDQELDVYGYRCKCLQGFEGNPYLTPGCTDINECQGTNNACSYGCINTPGSYRCYCPNGYRGDGMKNGTGCYPKDSKSVLSLGLGIGLGTTLFIVAAYLLFLTTKRRKAVLQRANNFKRNGGLLLEKQISSEEFTPYKTMIVTVNELDKATDHFNVDRVLGEGGQGTVYKGMLSDGNIVAIKKSTKIGESHVSEFINEVVILSQINHRNIVKLLGCCLETEIPLLVYEFVPNGTLSSFIHDKSPEFPLTWELRMQIAIDVAGALSYLHSASSKPIFHRDIKSSNILLDEKYRAKLSDFGSSRLLDTDQTHLTTRVQGTFGYLDPEYFRSNQFTEKSDVYGFGVVLVELLTGLRAILPSDPYEGKSLVGWFLSAMESNADLDDILAARVVKEASRDAALAVATLARRCLCLDGKDRPTMREVFVELEMISQVHYVFGSDYKGLPKVLEKTPKDFVVSPSSSLSHPYGSSRDWNWSTTSQFENHSMEKFS